MGNKIKPGQTGLHIGKGKFVGGGIAIDVPEGAPVRVDNIETVGVKTGIKVRQRKVPDELLQMGFDSDLTKEQFDAFQDALNKINPSGPADIEKELRGDWKSMVSVTANLTAIAQAFWQWWITGA